MDKTIKDLYHGRINPVEKPVEPGTEIDSSILAIANHEEQLRAILPEGTKQALDSLMELHRNMLYQSSEERFVDGFKLGAKLAIEMLIRDGGALQET